MRDRLGQSGTVRQAPQVAPSSSPVPRELRGGAAVPSGPSSRDLSGGNPQVPGLRLQRTSPNKAMAPQSAIQQAFTSPAQEVPHRREMESAFGQSFSDVRAYTGAPANSAAEGLGASAFTLGTDVAFQSANPNKQTVAHELTHVVQQRNGADPGLRKQSPTTGDSLEEEAEEIGRKVAQGEAAVVAGQDAPTLRKEELSGTPREVRDANFQPLTTHAMPTLADTVESRPTPAPPERLDVPQNVAIFSGPYNKLDVGVDACPFPGLIYGIGPAESPPPFPYTPVNGIVGSVAAPIVEQQTDPGLYIGGRPSADDVHQMSIGDCYFLSTLMSLASRDPGQITSMMTPDGKGGATVRLYRVQVESSWLGLCQTRKFVPVDVKVDGKLDYWGPQRVSNGHGGFQLSQPTNFNPCGPPASQTWRRPLQTGSRSKSLGCSPQAPTGSPSSRYSPFCLSTCQRSGPDASANTPMVPMVHFALRPHDLDRAGIDTTGNLASSSSPQILASTMFWSSEDAGASKAPRKPSWIAPRTSWAGSRAPSSASC